MPALRQKREQRPENKLLKGVEKQLRKLQRRKQYEVYADVPPEFAIDAARALPSDDARRDVADELRDQASDTDDDERRERLAGVAGAIESMCTSSDSLPEGEESWPMWIPENAKAWADAECRCNLIVGQMKAVCPEGILTDAGAWILEGNIDNLSFKTDPTLADRMLLAQLKIFEDNLYNPVELDKRRRVGIQPEFADSGGKANGKREISEDDLDYTSAGKKKRTKALPTVRRLDPTTTPIAPLKPRDRTRAIGWGRFSDDSDRPTPLDQERSERKRKDEARRTNEAARHARRERRWGIGKRNA